MGSVTLRPRPIIAPHERRQRILDLARRLAARRDNISLDEIDGEFYWRCCRLDFVEAIEALRPRLLSDGPIDGEELESAMGTLDRLARSFGIPQSAIAALLSEDAPIAVNEPALAFHYRDDDRDYEAFKQDVDRRAEELGVRTAAQTRPWTVHATVVDRLSVKVPTPTMTGADVAMRVARFLAAHERAGVYFCHPRSRSSFELQLAGDLVSVEVEEVDMHLSVFNDRLGVATGRPLVFASYGAIPPPYIRFVIGFPWPPACLIARNYDAARDLHPEWAQAWGAAAAAASKQEPRVAIRTWAVCLLMNAAIPEDEAMRLVGALPGLGTIARPGLYPDRTKLLRRVPQAASYLYPPGYGPPL
jgi:hypothetical protein